MAGILDLVEYSPDDIMNDVLTRLSYAPMDNVNYSKAYELAKPYTEMASRYGYGENPSLKQGLGSDVRHTTGSALAKFAIQDYLNNNFGVPTNSFISDKLSNLGIYGSTAAQEIQDAYRNVKNLTGYGVDFRDALDRGLVQPMEDVTANIRATNIPYGTPVEEIVKYAVENSPSKYMQAAPQLSSLNSFGPQNYETPQEKANNNFLQALSNLFISPVGAAEVVPEAVQNKNDEVSDTVLAEPKGQPQFQDYPGVENLAGAQRFDLQGVQNIISQMEEEKGNYIERPEDRFSLSGILENLKGYGRDAAGRYVTGNVAGNALGMITKNPAIAGIGALGGLLFGGNLFNPNTYSQNAYNSFSPQGKQYIDTLYQPGGIMSGYNKVSAFGRGPLESITNRISKTTNPVVKQQLITAAKNITDSGQDTSKTGINAVTQKGRYSYDDAQFSGGKGSGGTGGSGSKIVCTMMNESYGFGNFRNKIWLKHSRDLPKEYEIGYHAIFLPLVKFAKKKGKLNKLVKKTLEHVAKHRTIDLKQEMRGKKHLLGRIYRKVLEPICYLVGKIKNA